MTLLAQARRYDNLELLARQLVEGFITGLHKSPYHGFSVEFAEHKAYNPGESLRHLDWKLYARTDKLYSRRYEEETNLRCQLVLDASPSMYYPRPGMDKIRFATLATACLAWMLHRQRDAAGLITFDEHIRDQTRIRSTAAHIQQIFSLLEKTLAAPTPAKGGSALPETLHYLAGTLGQRALVIIMTDMLLSEEADGDAFTALQHLRHNKHEVLLFHITHAKTEVELALPDKPTRFIDAETGAELKVNPYEIRTAYRAQAEQRLQSLKLRCAQNRIDFIEADTDAGVDAVLQAYLAKRARVG